MTRVYEKENSNNNNTINNKMHAHSVMQLDVKYVIDNK